MERFFSISDQDATWNCGFTTICYWTVSHKKTLAKMAGFYFLAKDASWKQANFWTYLLFSIQQILHKAKWPQSIQLLMGRKFNLPYNFIFLKIFDKGLLIISLLEGDPCIQNMAYSSDGALAYTLETFRIIPESEPYSDLCQISKMKRFAKIVKEINYH